MSEKHSEAGNARKPEFSDKAVRRDSRSKLQRSLDGYQHYLEQKNKRPNEMSSGSKP